MDHGQIGPPQGNIFEGLGWEVGDSGQQDGSSGDPLSSTEKILLGSGRRDTTRTDRSHGCVIFNVKT